MSKNIWIMAGCPGSGKTYYAKNTLMGNENWFYISRDEVRYSMLKDNDEYFSKETEVYKEFMRRINDIIMNEKDYNIIADATHLNTASRMKLINHLNMTDNINFYVVWMKTPETICQQRNKLRSGRACVPEDALHNMYKRRTHPSKDNFKYTEILEVDDT